MNPSRRSLAAALLFMALSPVALGAPPAAVPETVTQWEQLVPPGWDPMAGLRDSAAEALRDNDPRAAEVMNKLRAAWDNAPVRPELAGRPIRLPGYLVPLESEKDAVSELLLVPYFGACIHTPPPPANQIVHVRLARPAKFAAMEVVTISGRLEAGRIDSPYGVASYRVEQAGIEKYRPPAR